jgi:hypothetical protein
MYVDETKSFLANAQTIGESTILIVQNHFFSKNIIEFVLLVNNQFKASTIINL